MVQQWWQVALIFTGATATGLLGALLSYAVGRLAARRRRYQHFLTQLHHYCRYPWGALLVLSANSVALSATHLSGSGADALRHALQLAIIGAAAWLVVKVLLVVEDFIFLLLRVDVPTTAGHAGSGPRSRSSGGSPRRPSLCWRSRRCS
jgi:hypothetical protein